MTAAQTAPLPSTAAPLARTGVLFPGQGSQRAGMARDWRDDPAFARWAEADDILRRDVSRLGLTVDADELREPVNCQVALFVHHAVLLDAWQRRGGTPSVAAGHSLGEYSALLAAGVVDFPTGLRLVDARAHATQTAAQRRPGGMAACLGADPSRISSLAEASGVWIANDNASGQTVVAGEEHALERFIAQAQPHAKVRRLDVAAAYHSPLMAPASDIYGETLAGAPLSDARIPVVANVDARVHTAASQWRSLLLRQLTAPVRWRETALMLEQLVTHVVELGAAPVVTPMIKRTAPALVRAAVANPAELETAA